MRTLSALKNGINFAWREKYSRELFILFSACLIATIAFTSINFFITGLNCTFSEKGQEFIAASAVLRSSNPILEPTLLKASENGLTAVPIASFLSMVVPEDENIAPRLASIKAISDGYPLYGELSLQNPLPTKGVPNKGEVWIDITAKDIIGIDLGAVVFIGNDKYKVTNIITLEPDRGNEEFFMGSRVMMNLEDLNNSGLLIPGSRATYNLLLDGTRENILKFKEEIQNQFTDNFSWIDSTEPRPSVEDAMQNVKVFLNLCVIMTSLLTGVVIATVASYFTNKRKNTFAFLLVSGVSKGKILLIFATQLLVFFIAAFAFGLLLSHFLQGMFLEIFSLFFQRFSISVTPKFDISVAMTSFVFAVTLVTGFGLTPLIGLLKITPMQIYRNSKINISFPTISVVFGTVLISFFIILLMISERELFIKAFGYMILGITAISLLLLLILKVLPKINIPNATLRLVVRDLSTNKYFHIWQILGYCIVLVTILTIYIVSSQILPGWIKQIPVDAPNFFAINIPSAKKVDFQNFLKENNMFPEEIYPLVRGRLVAVNNSYERNYIERPLNMTFSSKLPSGNNIISGKWTNGQQVKDYIPISIEEGFAERMGVSVGDSLTFAVQGEEFTGKIDSVRAVVWNEFKPNFFIIFPDYIKDKFSYTYMTSVFIPKESQIKIREMTEKFPSVTLIDVEGIIWQISSIFSVIDKSISYLWVMILAASALISYAYVLTSKDYKIYELGLFRALGAKKSQIQNLLLGEFVIISTLVAFIGLAASIIATYYLASNVFKISFELNLLMPLLITMIYFILVVVVNLISMQNTLQIKITDILRR